MTVTDCLNHPMTAVCDEQETSVFDVMKCLIVHLSKFNQRVFASFQLLSDVWSL